MLHLIIYIPTLLLLPFIGSIEHTGNVKKYTLKSEAEFQITGTSTMHDWIMTTKDAQGEMDLTEENGKLIKISSLSLKLKAESLKSDKDEMDKNAYKALKTDSHPYIEYKLTDVLDMSNGSIYKVKAKGVLNLAGSKRLITMDVNAKVLPDGIEFTGKTKLKMSDYHVKPPKFLGGLFKTGDEVDISFKVIFNEPK